MKAIVKKIRVKTRVSDEDHEDTFTVGMKKFIGSTLTFEQRDFCSEWFKNVPESENDPYSYEYGYNFHRSWLEFVEEK